MLERKWGRVINTGSMHALVASPYKSAYNAAKHGIAGAAPQRFLLPLHAI
jgi:3-hydroxybutyrate dehydrogenase